MEAKDGDNKSESDGNAITSFRNRYETRKRRRSGVALATAGLLLLHGPAKLAMIHAGVSIATHRRANIPRLPRKIDFNVMYEYTRLRTLEDFERVFQAWGIPAVVRCRGCVAPGRRALQILLVKLCSGCNYAVLAQLFGHSQTYCCVSSKSCC